jgi:DinB superfamily
VSTTMTTKTEIPNQHDTRVLARVLEEGYGPGAWHGADLKAAIADVSPELAFWRPSTERHNIAEIALHHAYFVRDVRSRLTGQDPGKFVLDGEEWFALPDASRLSWPAVREAVENEQRRLHDAVDGLDARDSGTAQTQAERLDLVLGITCHAVYHAGQVQLLKKLAAQ